MIKDYANADLIVNRYGSVDANGAVTYNADVDTHRVRADDTTKTFKTAEGELLEADKIVITDSDLNITASDRLDIDGTLFDVITVKNVNSFSTVLHQTVFVSEIVDNG